MDICTVYALIRLVKWLAFSSWKLEQKPDCCHYWCLTVTIRALHLHSWSWSMLHPAHQSGSVALKSFHWCTLSSSPMPALALAHSIYQPSPGNGRCRLNTSRERCKWQWCMDQSLDVLKETHLIYRDFICWKNTPKANNHISRNRC